jgi:hypothetical protein
MASQTNTQDVTKSIVAKERSEPVQKPVEMLTLAEQIGALHREIEAQPARYTEMHALLTQAKREAGDGGWLKWLADNRKVLGFGERQAQLYLRPPASRDADQSAHRERMAAHRERQSRAMPQVKGKGKWVPVGEALGKGTNADGIEEPPKALSNTPASDASRDLMFQIVEAGYRAMSLKMHPDTGGTAEEQRALTAARDWLVTVIRCTP